MFYQTPPKIVILISILIFNFPFYTINIKLFFSYAQVLFNYVILK